MARTKPIRRSYSAGEWGRNRVRVFPDPKTGLYQIEWRENGRRLTRSLKHRDWARAKRRHPFCRLTYRPPPSRISTRRFCRRPAAVPLSATGRDSPAPCTSTRSAPSPGKLANR